MAWSWREDWETSPGNGKVFDHDKNAAFEKEKRRAKYLKPLNSTTEMSDSENLVAGSASTPQKVRHSRMINRFLPTERRPSLGFGYIVMFIPMNNSMLDLSWLLIYKAGTNRRMPGIMVCHPGIFTVYQRLFTDDHNFRFVQQGFHLVNNTNTLWMVPGGRSPKSF